HRDRTPDGSLCGPEYVPRAGHRADPRLEVDARRPGPRRHQVAPGARFFDAGSAWGIAKLGGRSHVTMPGKFVFAKEAQFKVDDFGTSRRLSDPTGTGSKQLTVIEVNFDPGKGHSFHKHPDQEEVVLVLAGPAREDRRDPRTLRRTDRVRGGRCLQRCTV